MTAGNDASVQHGLHATNVPAEFLSLQTEFLAGAVADDGGVSEIPTRRMSQLEYRAVLHRKIVQLTAALDTRGIIDPKGRLRVAWLQQLQKLVASAVRVDSLLGLERRSRKVGDLDAYLKDTYGAGQESGR